MYVQITPRAQEYAHARTEPPNQEWENKADKRDALVKMQYWSIQAGPFYVIVVRDDQNVVFFPAEFPHPASRAARMKT